MILTIAIPTFNRASYLENLLSSIAEQSADPSLFEVVISDNCSTDHTPELVQKFKTNLSNIKYSRNDENIGADRNILKCHHISNNKFVWVLGDDEFFGKKTDLENIIQELKQVDERVNLILLKQVAFNLVTKTPFIIYDTDLMGNVFFENGKDIIQTHQVACEMGGISSCIFRKGILNNSFIEKYGSARHVGPLALALYGASTGATLFLNRNYVYAGIGVKQSWNRYWTSIFYIEEPEMMLIAVNELGYSPAQYQRIIQNMKKARYRINMDYLSLVLNRNDVSWVKLARIYGLGFLLINLLISPFMIAKNSRIIKKIYGKFV